MSAFEFLFSFYALLLGPSVAKAWLLQRSPNLLLIPGTSSVAHLTANLKAADLVLPKAAVAQLDRIGS